MLSAQGDTHSSSEQVAGLTLPLARIMCTGEALPLADLA